MHVLIPALHRPTRPTGVCRYAINLARSLAASDRISQVTVLIGKWQADYFSQCFDLHSPKIEFLSVDIENSSLSRNYWYIFGLPKLVTQLQPDIVHVSFPIPLLQQLFRIPITSTIHDLYPYEYPQNFGYPQVWFNQFFLRLCIYASDGITCVSNCTLESLRNYFPRVENNKKAAVIYNLVDFQNVEAIPPKQLDGTHSGSFLLTVSQHRKNKNLDVLIRSYRQLIQDESIAPSTKLVLVGSVGPETERLTNLVTTFELEHQVLFMSNLEDSELIWLYKHALLFAIPSAIEGFCLPLVEALACGCPVVCSDIPIFREVGSKQCNYFQLNGNSVSNLSAAIARNLNSRMSQQKAVDRRFSQDCITQQLLDFYLSIKQ